MKFLRASVRLIRLTVWFAYMALKAIRGTRKLDFWTGASASAAYAKEWSLGVLRILNLRIEVIGTLPEDRDLLVVSNHLGYVDVVVHGALTGLRFAPKKEIRSWPLIGSFVGLSRPVWIDRSSRTKSAETLRAFEETLAHGIALIVYPEGTSTDGKHGILPFKSTPFEAAIAGNHPILPLLTSYEDLDGTMNPAWFGDQTFLPHLRRLLGLRGIRAKIYVGEVFRADGLDRKQLARKAHEKMSGMYRAFLPDYGVKNETSDV